MRRLFVLALFAAFLAVPSVASASPPLGRSSISVVGTEGTTVPSGSYTAAFTCPAGAFACWAVFSTNIDIIVEHDGTATALEFIGSATGWSLFAGGQSGGRLGADYTVKFKGNSAATTVTVFSMR